jgi:signal transduction histidine kinase
MRLRYRVGDDATSNEILDTIERTTQFTTEILRRMQTPLRQEASIRTNLNGLIRDAIGKCIQEGDRFPDVQLMTNLPDLVRDEIVPSIAPGWKITIMVDFDEQLPATYAACGQLTEVFRVLVENAVKAIYPNSGTVKVVSKLESDPVRQVVEVTVSDTGKGIDEKTAARLFKQPVPRKEFGQGAGLGLWLSQIIVRSHQGSIELQSTKLNHGSTFRVRLPILSRPSPAGDDKQGGGEAQ